MKHHYRNPYRPVDLGGDRLPPRPARSDQRTLLRRHLSERLRLLRAAIEQPITDANEREWEDSSARLRELGLLCAALGLDPDALAGD